MDKQEEGDPTDLFESSPELQERLEALAIAFDQEKLLKDGFIHLKGVLTPSEVEKFRELFLRFYEETSAKKLEHPLRKEEATETHGFKYDDKETYVDSNLLVALHGILKNYQIGHAECMWYLRTHPVVIYLFVLLHGTDKLFTSLDGACFIPNRQWIADKRKSGRLPTENKSWLHKDLDPRFNESGKVYGVQAQFCMTNGGHLRVVPGSHLIDNSASVSGPVNHWFKPSAETPGFEFDKSTVIEAEKGDCILWFSNTTHSGSITSNERMTAYVCMHPKSHLTPADTKRFQEKIFSESRSTDHWGRRMNGVNPQTYGLAQYDATLLEPRESGTEIFLETATPFQKHCMEIFKLKSTEGLLNGVKFEPLINVSSLEEGRKYLAAQKKVAGGKRSAQKPLGNSPVSKKGRKEEVR